MVEPNYAVAPGAYLEEWIEDQGLTQQKVAKLVGSSRKQINEIVNGRAPITTDTAIRLERVVGIKAQTWLKYETLYRADLARIADQMNLATFVDEINPEAAAYLRRIGVTKATKRQPGQLVSDFLAFHQCGTWESYEALYEEASSGDFALAALKESGATLQRTLLTPWLRSAELSEAFELGRSYEYNADNLWNALPKLRDRVAHPDPMMLKDVAAILADVGVVFIVTEPPKNLPLRGMTRWIDKKVPVIQQTGRWRRDGFVIWALFHELGHVLGDPRGEMHFEFSTEKKRDSSAERAANRFAETVLLGDSGIEPFRGLTRDRQIKATAERTGIAPGVAVHLLHRNRMLDYSYGNSLYVDLSGTFIN